MKITIDRKALFTLASETRINLLKELDKRRMTQSELSKELEVSKTAVKEHLDKLEEAGLVERSEEGRKWIYYELTGKGKYVLHPGSKITITLMLSAAIATIGGGFFELYRYIMSKFALGPTLTPTPEPAPVEQPTPTPQPTTPPEQPVGPEATPSPTPAETPMPAETTSPTPLPTETVAPTEIPTGTGTPEPVPTSATETPAPTPTGTPPEVPTAPPAETPVPTSTTPEPITTPTATPAPTPTGTPVPEAALLPPEIHLLAGIILIALGALLVYIYRRR
ncbi:MAG: ArsR family transcriptional regulator [Archaeoglobaceae archaeon]